MKYEKAYGPSGSSMGRWENTNEPNLKAKFQLQRVPINSGGYDPGGAYWGLAEPLYVAWADGEYTMQRVFVRAHTRDHAKALVRKHFRNARFWR